MAYLATLEGEGNITLDDLYNVNDFLGVRIFGVEPWNRIKQYACQLTENAARSPVLFCISNIDKDYKKPSELSCELFGFNDRLGTCAMGATAWNTLKGRLDDELLGWNPLKSVKNAVEKVVNKATDVVSVPLKVAVESAKKVVDVPNKIIDTAVNKTPLKYTPAAKLVNTATDAQKKLLDKVKTATQTVIDTTSAGYNAIVDKTPLKYVPGAQVMTATEKVKEKAGVTSPGTAGVMLTKEEENKLKAEAAAAAARAASKASHDQSVALTKAYVKKQEQEKTEAAKAETAQAKQEQAATQQALDVMENRVSSKYAPIFIAGTFGLLALLVLKK